MVSDFSRPLGEALAVPLHIVLVVRRHMIFHCVVLMGSAIEPEVRANANAYSPFIEIKEIEIRDLKDLSSISFIVVEQEAVSVNILSDSFES